VGLFIFNYEVFEHKTLNKPGKPLGRARLTQLRWMEEPSNSAINGGIGWSGDACCVKKVIVAASPYPQAVTAETQHV